VSVAHGQASRFYFSIRKATVTRALTRPGRRAGDTVSYTLKTAMLVHMVNLSVALINNCTAQVFRDLDVF
jgi:hypothetical protein